MEQQRWDDDERLLAELGEAVRSVEPAATVVGGYGREAFTWRSVDEDVFLACLSFDSELEDSSVMRAGDPGLRRLVFAAESLSVELEVTGDGLVGQIVPPAPGVIHLEGRDGTDVVAAVDELGCFLVSPVPRGYARLRFEASTSRLVTEWLSL